MNFIKFYSNCQISPIYQAIRDFPKDSAPLGDPNASYFELVLEWLGLLMQVYQESKTEKITFD